MFFQSKCTDPVMVLICKLGQFWFGTPLVAHMKSGPAGPAWGVFLSGARVRQLEYFSTVAGREHKCWPQRSPPAYSVCRPCCPGSSLSSPSHGQPSSQVTFLAQDPHLLCQTLIARRPHRAVTPRSVFCLGSDGVGTHCGSCGRHLCRQSWRKARGSQSGSAGHWRCSCRWVHPSEARRSRVEARGLNAPAVCSGLAGGKTRPWSLCTHKNKWFFLYTNSNSLHWFMSFYGLFMTGRRLCTIRYDTF